MADALGLYAPAAPPPTWQLSSSGDGYPLM